MWWNRELFGWNTYHIVWWFLTYSMLGWIVESAYMSFCNRKFTNRGFGRGPFCPIYGIGALAVYFILRPYSHDSVVLFLMGSFLATAIEFLTALLMNRIFGCIWWDYTNKKFNYKGILCLESSVAWGFYTLFLFMFLQNAVMAFVDRIPMRIGKVAGTVILLIFITDFVHSFYVAKKDVMPERFETWRNTIRQKLWR